MVEKFNNRLQSQVSRSSLARFITYLPTDLLPHKTAQLVRAIFTLLGVIITLYMANCAGLAMVIAVITAKQIRAGRALLGWSQQQLADRAIISLNALTRLERGEVDPRVSTILAIQQALSRAGIEFIADDGVRLLPAPLPRRPRPKT